MKNLNIKSLRQAASDVKTLLPISHPWQNALSYDERTSLNDLTKAFRSLSNVVRFFKKEGPTILAPISAVERINAVVATLAECKNALR